MKRRHFIKNTSATGLGIGLLPAPLLPKKRNTEKIRIGFIGTGLRGRNHVNNLLRNDHVISPAFCDIDPDAVNKTLALYDKHGQEKPTVYTGSETAFREMLDKEQLDGVIIATNWRWHTPTVLAALNAGVYTGVEVAGAGSVDECWQWVNAHERTGTHLFFLENVCYRRDVMAVLNMVRDNVFGELLHCRGGYLHDLRHVKFDDGKGGLVFGKKAVGEARWRTQHSLTRNADLYPTHGLGPVAMMLDINRGNRFSVLTSMATKARSLAQYAEQHDEGGTDHPYAQLEWALGDIVTTTLRCARGETIVLTHDTNSPRPYSLGFRVQGTNGLIDFDYGNRRVYVEGKSPNHRWEEAKAWLDKYDHPYWKAEGEIATGAGHGGMDYFLDKQFVECVRQQKAPPFDVYDAAAWKCITPLSEASIAAGGAPQAVPDFTNGKWIDREPVQP